MAGNRSSLHKPFAFPPKCRGENQMGFALNKNDRKLLVSIAQYKTLTVKQLSAISQRSFQVIRRRMRDLANEGFITTKMQGYGRSRGRPEDLVFLTDKGTALLEEEGTQSGYPVRGVPKTANSISIDHLLLVNWFRIHLLQMERTIPSLSIQFLTPTSPAPAENSGENPSLPESTPANNLLKKFDQFIPDGVFSITHREIEGKTLLFFLEVDMGTETIASMDRVPKGIHQKISNYQELFRSGGYKRYESVFKSKLNGFRLLFLANSEARLISLCRLAREMRPSDFIWLTDQGRMFSHGLAAKIWARGGRNEDIPQSILGPGLVCELPRIDR
jgi:hypothetical protein